MDEPPPVRRRQARSVDEHCRELLRLWRRDLLAQDFTDEQAARLVFAKMLYIRGRLRD